MFSGILRNNVLWTDDLNWLAFEELSDSLGKQLKGALYVLSHILTTRRNATGKTYLRPVVAAHPDNCYQAGTEGALNLPSRLSKTSAPWLTERLSGGSIRLASWVGTGPSFNGPPWALTHSRAPLWTGWTAGLPRFFYMVLARIKMPIQYFHPIRRARSHCSFSVYYWPVWGEGILISLSNADPPSLRYSLLTWVLQIWTEHLQDKD